MQSVRRLVPIVTLTCSCGTHGVLPELTDCDRYLDKWEGAGAVALVEEDAATNGSTLIVIDNMGRRGSQWRYRMIARVRLREDDQRVAPDAGSYPVTTQVGLPLGRITVNLFENYEPATNVWDRWFTAIDGTISIDELDTASRRVRLSFNDLLLIESSWPEPRNVYSPWGPEYVLQAPSPSESFCLAKTGQAFEADF